MKRIHLFITLLIGLIVLLASCDSTETYADKLKNETKAIDRFIRDNNIEVIDHIEKGQKFGEKQFYKDETGVYLRIIDSGNLDIMASEEEKTDVTVRFDAVLTVADSDTLTYGNHSQIMDEFPMNFKYGDASTYRISSSTTSYYESFLSSFMSPGLALPLKYVGHKGRVEMIIPFNVGSYNQAYNSYIPYHYTEVEYKIHAESAEQ